MANEHVPLRFDGQVIPVLGLGANQLITATATHVVTTTLGAGVHAVRIAAAQQGVYYAYGVDPTADAAGAGQYLPGDGVEYPKVAPGDIVSVIQYSASAVVTVTEIS